MSEYQFDTGKAFADLVQERDDALATLRLREADVRYWQRANRDLNESVARLQTQLQLAQEAKILEREKAARYKEQLDRWHKWAMHKR